MTSRPFFISATQDVVSQDSGSPSTGPTITMLPSTISISDPAAPRPNQVTTTTATTATRSFLSTTSWFPPPSPTPHDTAARDRESLLGYFLVAFICFCLGSAFTLAVLSCLRRFQVSRHRSRASSPTESDCESSSFSTEAITGSDTHSSSENPSAGKQRREEGGTAASTSASASAETSSANIAQLHSRGYFSVSDLGPSNSSSNSNRRKSSMAPKSFYQHQVPSESWSDPGVGVVAVGSKSTLQAQQQMGSAVEQMPAMASTSSETHRGALASKSARVKSDSSIRMGFELVRVATAHSGRFIRPAAAAAAAGERVDSGHIRLGSGSGSGGGSVSEPALPLAADGSTNAPSSRHIQAHLVHFSKEGQGVVSGPHEATAAASSATGGVDTSELVEDSSCSRTVTSEDGSVATVVGVCFDVISPPPPPPPSPAVQPAESCLEIIEDSITVLVNDIAPILTTTISSSPMLVCESDSNIRVQPIIIDPTTTATTSTVQPQQLQQDLHDTVSSSTAQSHLNDEVISFYLPPPPFPQRQRSLTGLPIASRHRALPIRDLDLSASRPATPLPSVHSHSRSRSRGDSLQATQTQRNFSLPILHSSGISDSLKGEGFDVRVQHWRKPAELKEKLGHITTIEELEDYALCGEALTTEVGPPPVIRAPGSGLQRQPASYPPPPPTTTTMDGIEVGESSNSHLGSSEGGRARQSVRSLESRVEMLKGFPIPPTIVVVEAESQEKSQGDSGSGLGL